MTIVPAERVEAIGRRLDRLTPDQAPRWGRMSAGQMLCHLADTLRFALGERPAGRDIRLIIPGGLLRWVALRTPLPWIRGAPTLPAFDQEVEGTPPSEFEADREELKRLLALFAQGRPTYPRHPLFGEMTPADWGRWAERHADHHLRQFGV